MDTLSERESSVDSLFQKCSDYLQETKEVESNARAWIRVLTTFLKACSPGHVHHVSIGSTLYEPDSLVATARNNALVAAFARLSRICDQDLPDSHPDRVPVQGI